MPPIGRPPLSTFLDRIFRASGTTAWPREVAEAVLLTHPWFAPTVVFEKKITAAERDIGYFSENVSTGGVTGVYGADVPAGFFDIVLAADATHTDVAVQDCHLVVIFAACTTVVAAQNAMPGNVFLPTNRPILIPATGKPGAEFVAMPASIRLRTCRVRLIPGMGTL